MLLSLLSKKRIIFLMGITCVGKSEVAISLKKTGVPINLISVDSALVYRDMNIGTGKPTPEQLLYAPHKLIDCIDPKERYSVMRFYTDSLQEIRKSLIEEKIPFLVGGTMMYYHSLLSGLSILPEYNQDIRNYINLLANKYGWLELHKQLQLYDYERMKQIHHNDRQRILRAWEIFLISKKKFKELSFSPPIRPPLPIETILIIVISPVDLNDLYNNIHKRVYRMLDLGFEEEVKRLFLRPDINYNLPSMRCIGYRQMWNYLDKKISFDTMIHQIIQSNKKLVKHQRTWLKKFKSRYDLYCIKNFTVDDTLEQIYNLIQHLFQK